MTQRPVRAAALANKLVNNSSSHVHNTGMNHDDNVIDLVHYLMGGVTATLSKETEARTALDIGKMEYRPVTVDARKRIERVLGCTLMANDGKMYMYNTLKQPDSLHIENPREEEKDGFLVIVLTLLFMLKNPDLSSSKVTKTMLWEALEHFGLEEGISDQFLGDLKDLIAPRPSAEFISKGWVSFKRVKDEADEIYFEWGPRALSTVDAVELFKNYLTVMGIEDVDEENLKESGWRSYMKRAKRMRKEMKIIQAEAAAKFSNSST